MPFGLLLLGLLVLLPGGCDVDDPGGASAAAPRSRLPGVLVSAEWLSRHLGATDLVLLDARSPESYREGHLPGARNLPLAALMVQGSERGDELAPVTRVQEQVGARGVDMHVRVVVYDDANYRESASVFWALEVHGHPAVAVLDGGLAAWKAAGGALSREEPEIHARSFVAELSPERLATKLTVARALESADVVVLDARSADEFTGLRSKARRYGHIKGAVHVDFGSNLEPRADGGCFLKSMADLLPLYDAALQGRSRVITYCNTGHRASVSYLALRALGIQAAVYDGSWMEWGNDPDLPIESAPEGR